MVLNKCFVMSFLDNLLGPDLPLTDNEGHFLIWFVPESGERLEAETPLAPAFSKQ